MTALLPPNLLRLFAPRPPVPYLKPVSRDERVRGPDKLTGVAALLAKIKEEAEEAELRQGLEEKKAEEALVPAAAAAEDKPATTNGGGEDGEVVDGKEKEKEKPKTKKKKTMLEELGLVGQAARDFKKEMKKKRQVEYKKDSEKSCELHRRTVESIIGPADGMIRSATG
jgi:U1 small nuclear ribonucleoprotein